MKVKYLTILLFFTIFSLSCKKDWLSEKRDISIITPTTLRDLRLLLNVNVPINYDSRGIVEISADDFFMKTTGYQALSLQVERKAFIWSNEIFGGETAVAEWDDAYASVLYANVILEALQKIEVTDNNRAEYESIKGGALYFRSKAFFNLIVTFAKQYNPATANTDFGIPLRLKSDVNQQVSRQTVAEVYNQITTDLEAAGMLLPPKGVSKADASKASAYGLLARCYLVMNKYVDALTAADKSLQYHSILLDFNSVNATPRFPIPYLNDENHIFSQLSRAYQTTQDVQGIVEPELYNMYEGNDLRKVLYFTPSRADGEIGFRGSSNGIQQFGGTATNEMLLIRAECKARANDLAGALSDINTLLVKRYKTGTYVVKTTNNTSAVLQVILNERRKELVRRGLRWLDLKRLNVDPLTTKTLVRTVNNQTYALPPNDPRYTFPIPDYIIQFNGIEQNIR